MRNVKKEVEKWQREQFRRYDKLAAKRMLRQAIAFLIIYTLLMMGAMAVSSL